MYTSLKAINVSFYVVHATISLATVLSMIVASSPAKGTQAMLIGIFAIVAHLAIMTTVRRHFERRQK